MLGTPAERQRIIATLEGERIDITQRVPEDWQRWAAQVCGVSRSRVAYHLVAERERRGQHAPAWARLTAEREAQAAAGQQARSALVAVK